MGEAKKPKKSLTEVLKAAGHRALGGGIPGAAAMAIQVTSLMWMRTTMNFQYRHGSGTFQAMRTLYKEGGIRRFYRGYGPAIFQGPLSRFGDTAANAGVLALLESNETTNKMPVWLKTVAASATAAGWRIFLMPIDALKTTLQVEGPKGIILLKNKIRAGGIPVLYHGALAAAGATFVGHYPWFFTFNFLDASLPYADGTLANLGRTAFMGFCASAVSDTCSNSIRVLKTYRQTNANATSYVQVVKEVVAKDGLIGLFGRGLRTRILANGVQGLAFAVLWKAIQRQFFPDSVPKRKAH